MGAIIDPAIALGYKPPQFQITDPVQAIANVYSLKNLMTEGTLKNLQIQQAQQQLEQERRQMAATQAINDALQGKTPADGTTALPAAPTLPPATPAVVPAAPVTPPQPGALTQAPPASPVSMSDLMNLPTVDRAAQMGALAGIPSLSQTPGAAIPPTPTPDALANVFPAISPPAPAAATPQAQPAPAPALPSSTPVGMLSRLPSDDVLLKAGGVAALPLIENLHKVRKAQLDAHISELDAGQKEVNDLANLATGSIDNDSLQHNLGTAYQKHYITLDQWRHYTQLGFDAPATQAFLKSAQDQALGAKNVQEMRINAAKELRDQYEFGPKFNEATSKAAVAQAQQDAMFLSAAARQGPDALAKATAAIGPDRAALFTGLTNPDEIMSRGQTPQQYMTAQEAMRHNLSTEEMARTNAALKAGELAETVRINNIEYGRGQPEYWANQIYQHPDSIDLVPKKLLGQVGQLFTANTGLPMPTALSDQFKGIETSARNVKDSIDFVRNAVKNPEIQGRLGFVLGRLGEAEQDVGQTAGLSPQAAQQAQELRTRLRSMLLQEGQTILKGRTPAPLIKMLESTSPSVKMDSNMLEGALKGVEGVTKDIVDNLDKQRFGGKMRRDTVPDDVKTMLGDAKQPPGTYTMRNGMKFLKSADGTITPVL